MNRTEFLSFVPLMRDHNRYRDEMHACELTLAAFPATFLAKWCDAALPVRGWIEYRIPTYSQLLGFGLWCGQAFRQPFSQEPDRSPRGLRRFWTPTLSARRGAVSRQTIAAHLCVPGGARVFHPVRTPIPLSTRGVGPWLATQGD